MPLLGHNQYTVSMIRNFGTEQMTFKAELSLQDDASLDDKLKEVTESYDKFVLDMFERAIVRGNVTEREIAKKHMTPEQAAAVEQQLRKGGKR